MTALLLLDSYHGLHTRSEGASIVKCFGGNAAVYLQVCFFISILVSFHCPEVRQLCALTSNKYIQALTSFCGFLVSRSRSELSLVSPAAQGGQRQGVAR